MAALNEGEFDLDGYTIGPKADAFVESFDPGYAETRDQDSDNPVGDDRAFGRDRLSGPVWTLDLLVNQYNAADALRVLGELSTAWRADKVRATPGALSVLRYAIGGRTRRVYGRPRKFAYTPNGVYSGAVQATGEFQTADPYFYDDPTSSVDVRLVAPSTGGFTAPFTAPIVTSSTGEAQGAIDDVGGDAPAHFALTFYGPVVNPKAWGKGWRMELDTTLKYDQSVTINTRTGTVLRNDGASLAGALSHRSNLGTSRLQPGPNYVNFAGADVTGTARCRLSWRSAFHGL